LNLVPTISPAKSEEVSEQVLKWTWILFLG
jgi:hypothetical protein